MLARFLIQTSLRNAACAALLMLATLPAQSATLNDDYWGGTNTYNPLNGDVIGPLGTFDISSVDVTRSGPGNNTLNVVIHTNYAGVPGTPAADGTGYGSLFFSTTGWSPQLSTDGPHYSNDKYQSNDWNFAFIMPKAPSANTGASALYAIGGNATAHAYNASGVPDYYTTQNGKVIMSNVNNNPLTYPDPGNPGFYFREGQAVQYVPKNAVPNAGTGTWTVDAAADTITFIINDGHILGDSFALAWAMTCANDVIQGPIVLHAGEDFPTPLPAAAWLFGTVIAGGAGVGRWRKIKKARALAA